MLVVEDATWVINPNKRSRQRMLRSLASRLQRRVNLLGPVPEHAPELGRCYVWLGSKNGDGYGHLRAGGEGSKLVQAHRVAYALHTGKPLADDVEVCHRCDNRACVRGEHLFEGTHQENIADASSKRRLWMQARPEDVPRGKDRYGAKLKDADVLEIRRLSRRGWSQRRIGKKFGVTYQLVGYVLRGKLWSHV